MFAHESGRKSLFKLADICLFKVDNRNTRTMCDIYPKGQRHIYNPQYLT